MSTYTFELVLAGKRGTIETQGDGFLEAVETLVFEAFQGDVTPALCGGVPVLYCTIDDTSIEAAVNRVASTVAGLGLHPDQLMMKWPSESFA